MFGERCWEKGVGRKVFGERCSEKGVRRKVFGERYPAMQSYLFTFAGFLQDDANKEELFALTKDVVKHDYPLNKQVFVTSGPSLKSNHLTYQWRRTTTKRQTVEHVQNTLQEGVHNTLEGGYTIPYRRGYTIPYRRGYTIPYRRGYTIPYRRGRQLVSTVDSDVVVILVGLFHDLVQHCPGSFRLALVQGNTCGITMSIQYIRN